MIIDMHVHLLGTFEANGCYVNPRVEKSLYFRFVKSFYGLSSYSSEDFDDAYVSKLRRLVQESDLDRVGLLALDGVYDALGRLDRSRTSVLVSNDYCLSVCRKFPEFLPICSINPQRGDALEELERVTAGGAVAIKVLPNSQGFDPSLDAYRPFWRRMADLKIPLLAHASFEHSLPVIDQRLGEPDRLRPALEEGATVITAHCASSGLNHFKEHFGIWLRMLEEFPALYGDISALVFLTRFPYLRRVLDHPLASRRVMLGSDYPVPVMPLLLARRVGWRKALLLRSIENPLQRNLQSVVAAGAGQAILERAGQVLRCP